MKFAELAIGAKFRFWSRGRLLTKTSKTGYTADLTGEKATAEQDTEVRPEDDDPPLAPRAAPKPDDMAVLTKAIDELEQFQRAAGAKPDPAVRQALRRLSALARLAAGR